MERVADALHSGLRGVAAHARPASSGELAAVAVRAGRIERAFTVVALLLTTDAILPLLRGGEEVVLDSAGDPVKQGIFLLLYAVSFVLLLWRGALLRSLRDAPLVWLFLGLAAASVLWSADPQLTMRRVAALGGTTVFGIYVGSTYGLRELARLLAWCGVLAVVLSGLLAHFDPERAFLFDGRGKAFNGIYGHKNEFGRFMAWTAFVATVVAMRARRARHRAPAIVLLCAALAVIALTTSKAALVVALVMLALVPACAVARWAARQSRDVLYGLLLVAAATGVTIAVVGLRNLAQVTAVFGRDATLTGRTYIWDAVLDSISREPMLGYGYSAFWGGPHSPAEAVWFRTGKLLDGLHVTHAHNGVLDIWLQLGAVGVALFLAIVATLLWWGVREARASGADATLLVPLGFVVFLLVYNSVESRNIQQNSFFWVMICALAMLRARRRELGVTTRGSSDTR